MRSRAQGCNSCHGEQMLEHFSELQNACFELLGKAVQMPASKACEAANL